MLQHLFRCLSPGYYVAQVKNDALCVTFNAWKPLVCECICEQCVLRVLCVCVVKCNPLWPHTLKHVFLAPRFLCEFFQRVFIFVRFLYSYLCCSKTPSLFRFFIFFLFTAAAKFSRVWRIFLACCANFGFSFSSYLYVYFFIQTLLRESPFPSIYSFLLFFLIITQGTPSCSTLFHCDANFKWNLAWLKFIMFRVFFYAKLC